MKKTLKIIGYTLVGLILIFITAALLIRFVFKEQMIAYTSKLEETERIELLRNATPYASDTAHYHFVYQQDTLQAQKIYPACQPNEISRKAQRHRLVEIHPRSGTGIQLPPALHFIA